MFKWIKKLSPCFEGKDKVTEHNGQKIKVIEFDHEPDFKYEIDPDKERIRGGLLYYPSRQDDNWNSKVYTYIDFYEYHLLDNMTLVDVAKATPYKPYTFKIEVCCEWRFKITVKTKPIMVDGQWTVYQFPRHFAIINEWQDKEGNVKEFDSIEQAQQAWKEHKLEEAKREAFMAQEPVTLEG